MSHTTKKFFPNQPYTHLANAQLYDTVVVSFSLKLGRKCTDPLIHEFGTCGV